MAGVAAMARCVGDETRFLEQVWGRLTHLQPPARPGLAEGFPDLMTLADVDALLSTTSLRAPFFRLVRSGTPVPVASYTRSSRIGGIDVTDVADPARVFAEFEDGATIVLQGMQRYWPPVTGFCRELELALGHPVQANAYITPPGSQGLNVHSDEHDVFVLQAFGRKQWEVHPAPGEPADGQPRDLMLEPGATLYLPLGTPHAARTQEEVSGHLTVGVLTTTWHALLSELARRLREDPSLDERLPAGYHRDRDGFARAVADRVADLAARIDKVDTRELADALVDRFATGRLPHLAGGLVDLVRLPSLSDDSVLRRRPGSVLEVRPEHDGKVRVLLGDRELRMPAYLDRVIREIGDRQDFRVAELSAYLDPESRLVLVRRLVQEGLLEIAQPAPAAAVAEARAD